MSFEDESSASSFSPSSPTDAPPNVPHKRKAGRKKFKETRHPIYRELGEETATNGCVNSVNPTRSLGYGSGHFQARKMAARAHDVADMALRGKKARLNFPDSSKVLPRPKLSSPRDIQLATRAFLPHKVLRTQKPCHISNTNEMSSTQLCDSQPCECSAPILWHGLYVPSKASSSSSSLSSSSEFSRDTSFIRNVMRPSSTSFAHANCQEIVLLEPSLADSLSVESHEMVMEPSSSDSTCLKSSEKILDHAMMVFVDEEAMFNMPGLLDSVAGGLLLTSPAMKRGFNWGDMAGDMDFTLWRY